MLDIISKVIAAAALVFSSFFIVKHIFKSNVKILRVKSIILLLVFIFITVVVYKVNYSPFAPILIYLIMILIYKFLFELNLFKSIMMVGVVFILYFIADIVVGIPMSSIFGPEAMRNSFLIFIFSNVLVSGLALLLSYIPAIGSRLTYFFNKLENNKYYDKVLFVVLAILVFSFIVYNIANAAMLSKSYLIDVIIMIFFFVLTFIYINEKISKDKLNSEYDKLMEYVETFENWIDDQQLNKHEYKNQLAVIRSMAGKNRKVTSYIDEILKDDVYFEDFWVNEIKYIPSGGIKGLLYYKLLLTKKENIDICLSVSREVKNYVKDVDNAEFKNISRVLGVYLDNAIDAAKVSNHKVIAIEIYPKNSELVIVISNTYDGNIDLDKVAKRGYTTKGKGHGKGLYFAEKIINKSSIMKSERSLINNYYVQKLIISK